MPIDPVDFCRALADNTRQGILKMLLERGEVSVGEIVSAFKMSQPTISHHLNVLKGYDLVRNRREGKQVFYSIVRENVDYCCGIICAKFAPNFQLVPIEEVTRKPSFSTP